MAEVTFVLLYIDPGAGFLIMQILGASMLSGAFYFRRRISQILERVRQIFLRNHEEESERLDR